MKTARWLLPFTCGVDMQAIDAVVRLAEEGDATLVAVSLVSTQDPSGSKGVRLEHLQQSKDFLEAVKWKALRLGVPLEEREVYTVDVMQSMTTLVQELCCDALVLVSRSEREVLLRRSQLKRLFECPPTRLLMLRLAAQVEHVPAGHPGTRILTWLAGTPRTREKQFSKRKPI
ncbi:MAG: universal stress protein [Ktedonobacteraceae bacterium]|nr:universal stress protein [Ktedonobacteraceae bacterium]